MQTAINVYMNQCSYCLKFDIKNVKQLLYFSNNLTENLQKI